MSDKTSRELLDAVTELGATGTDAEWFEATGHCGYCGLDTLKCNCTEDDPCGCGDLHGKPWKSEER